MGAIIDEAVTVRIVGCVVAAPCTAPPTQYRPGVSACDTVISYTPGVPPVWTAPASPEPVEKRARVQQGRARGISAAVIRVDADTEHGVGFPGHGELTPKADDGQ